MTIKNKAKLEMWRFFLLKKGIKVKSTSFWGILFLLNTFLEKLSLEKPFISPQSCLYELEELYMEQELHNPQTKEEFLFWAWNRCEDPEVHPTDDGYDDFWRIRHTMMSYHYLKARRELN